MMEQLIKNFTLDLKSAIEIADKINLSAINQSFSQILILGMGGSGIGGRIIQDLFFSSLPVPIICNNKYEIPHFVNSQTLVIAVSYSGNTEETIQAVEECKKRNASIICITSGGLLDQFSKSSESICLLIPGGKPPRTQLAFSFVLLDFVICKLFHIPFNKISYSNFANYIDENRDSICQKAKEIAKTIHQKETFIYSDENNESIAIRFRQQLNENSKILCTHHVFPEMNHNELVGWCSSNKKRVVTYFSGNLKNTQIKKRIVFFQEVLKNIDVEFIQIDSPFNDFVEHSLYQIHLGDWISFYLAELNNVDPIEINILNKLKSKLAE